MSSDVVQQQELRGALQERYLRSCDAATVEPCAAVLEWLSKGQLDEVNITHCTSLAASAAAASNNGGKRSGAGGDYGGSLVESDPLEPLLQVLKLIPLSHVSFDYCNLHPSQLNKLFDLLLDGCDGHSKWSLTSLFLYGNRVDATVFPRLLQVVREHPVLTSVHMDPSTHCPLFELEQLCAANEAKCRSTFVRKKHDEVKLLGSGGYRFQNAMGGAATQAAAGAPPQRDTPAAGFVGGSAAGRPSPTEFDISVSSFLGSIKTWIFFFYGSRKPIPHPMFHFLLVHTVQTIQQSTSADELMEELKAMEKRFTQWRAGSFEILDDTTAESCSGGGLPSAEHCAYCDEPIATQQPAESGGGSSSGSGGASNVDAAQLIFSTLLLESELGSKCFVQDSSRYLLRLFRALMRRCVTKAVADNSRSPLASSILSPPRLCVHPRGAKCAKRMCRALFCEAGLFFHGIPKLEEWQLRLAENASMYAERSRRNGQVRSGLIPAMLLFGSDTAGWLDADDMKRVFEHYAPKVPCNNDEKPWDRSPKLSFSEAVLRVFDGIIGSSTPGLSLVLDREYLSTFLPALPRCPTRGVDPVALFAGVATRTVQVSLVSNSAGGGSKEANAVAAPNVVVTSMRPTTSLQFAVPLLPDDPHTPFWQLLVYFLRERSRLRGSDVMMGIKLRPDVVQEMLSQCGATGVASDAHPRHRVACRESVDAPSRYGVPVPVRVFGVDRVGDRWYLVAEYQGTELLIDEVVANAGAAQYGAFAMCDCPAHTWVRAMQQCDPESLRQCPFPLDLLERSVEVEIVLLLLLHAEEFYANQETFASRVVRPLADEGRTAYLDLRRVMASVSYQPQQHVASVNSETIGTLARWYRENRQVSIVQWWLDAAHRNFRDFVCAAVRRFFAQRYFQRLHPAIAAHVASRSEKTPSVDGRRASGRCSRTAPLAGGPHTEILVHTSGKLLEARGSGGGEGGAPSADLNYLVNATAFSALANRRYLAVELSRPHRITRWSANVTVPKSRHNVTQSHRQCSVLFVTSYSDNGSVLHPCGVPVQLVLDHRHATEDLPETTLSCEWDCVGAHRFWFVECLALDAEERVLPDHFSTFPAVWDLHHEYLCDAWQMLMVEVSDDVVVACPSDQRLHGCRLTPSFQVTSSGAGAARRTLLGGEVDLHSPGSFFAGADAILGGDVIVAITLGDTIFAVREGFAVDLERTSGQVRSDVVRVSEHWMLSQLPRMFHRHLWGGFQLRSQPDLLFVYSSTHVAVINWKTLKLVVDLRSWALVPGRALLELDESGTATNSILLTAEGVDPLTGFAFPFGEVDWCVRSLDGGPTADVLLVVFHDRCLRWALDFTLDNAVAPPAALSDPTVPRKKLRAPLSPTMPTSRVVPRLERLCSTAAMLEAARESTGVMQHVGQLCPVVPLDAHREVRDGKTGRVTASTLSHGEVSALFAGDSHRSVRVLCNENQRTSLMCLTLRFGVPICPRLAQFIVDTNGAPLTLECCTEPRDHSAPTSADRWFPVQTCVPDSNGVATFYVAPNADVSALHWRIRPCAAGATDASHLLLLRVFHAEMFTASCRQTSRSGDVDEAVRSLRPLEPFVRHRLGRAELLLSQSPDGRLPPPASWDLRKQQQPSSFPGGPVVLGISLCCVEFVADTLLHDTPSEGEECVIAVSSRTDDGAVTVVATSVHSVLSMARINCVCIPFTAACVVDTLSVAVSVAARALVVRSCAADVHAWVLPLSVLDVRSATEQRAAADAALCDDTLSTAPVHLRVSPVQFARESLQNRSSSVSHLGDSRCTLRREKGDYLVTLSDESERRRVVRVTASLVTSKSALGWRSQPGTLYYQDLGLRWIPCAHTSITPSGGVDFLCVHTVTQDPPPTTWKIEFQSEKFLLRQVRFHVLDAAHVAGCFGYQLAPACSTVELLSPAHARGAAESKLVLASTSAVQEPVVLIEVPPSVPRIGGIILDTAPATADRLTSGPTTTVRVNGKLSASGEVVVLWSGTADAAPRWAPQPITELHIVNLRANIRSLHLLPATADDDLLDHNFRYTLRRGDRAPLRLDALPQSIPLDVGYHIDIQSTGVHAAESNVPLLFSSVSLYASVGGVRFQVSSSSTCSSDGEGTEVVRSFDVVAHVTSAAACRTVTSFGVNSDGPPPRVWRLTCVEIDGRSTPSQPQYVLLDVVFRSLQAIPRRRPLQLTEHHCAVTTNANVRYSVTADGPRRLKSLQKLCSFDDRDPDRVLRLTDHHDDWEQRSVLSTSSQASQMTSTTAAGGLSTPPFVFVLVDFRTEPKALSAVSIRAETDGMFELAVQWGDDEETFHHCSVHRQRNGWCVSSWSDHGAHRYWRLVATLTHLAQSRRSKRSLPTTDFTEERVSLAANTLSASLLNVVWYETEAISLLLNAASALGAARETTVALRTGALASVANVPALHPLAEQAIPVGMKLFAHRLLTLKSGGVAAEGVTSTVLWRYAHSRPSQALVRTALAAEEQLQHMAPLATNPHHVLGKDTAAEVTRVLFEGKDTVEFNDATWQSGTNQLTGDPYVTLRGSTLTGIRCIPPGTRIALQLQWFNTSLVPAQPSLGATVLFSMERTFLSVVSEIAAVDQLVRALPALRSVIFADLERCLMVYAVVRGDGVRVGGHFPPVPLPVQTLPVAVPELVIRRGATVISRPLDVASVRLLLQSEGGLMSALPFLGLFCGHVICSLYTPFEASSSSTAGSVCIDLHAGAVEDLTTGTGSVLLESFHMQLQCSALNSPAPVVSVAVDGCCRLPRYCGHNAMFRLHAQLSSSSTGGGDGGSGRKEPGRTLMSLAAADCECVTEHWLGQAPRVTFRDLLGTLLLSVESNDSLTGAHQNNNPVLLRCAAVELEGSLWFSSVLQVACSIAPTPQRADGQLRLRTGQVAVTQMELISFLDAAASTAGAQSTQRCRDARVLLSAVDDLFGSFTGTLNDFHAEHPLLQFDGTATFAGVVGVPISVRFGVCHDDEILVDVRLSFDAAVPCLVWLPALRLTSGTVRIEVLPDGSSTLSGLLNRSPLPLLGPVRAALHASTSAPRLSGALDVEVNVGAGIAYLMHVAVDAFGNHSFSDLPELCRALQRSLGASIPHQLVFVTEICPLWDVNRGSVGTWSCRGSIAGSSFAVVFQSRTSLTQDLHFSVKQVSAGKLIASLEGRR